MDDVKALAAGACALVLAITTLPAVLAGGDDPADTNCPVFGGDLAAVLATIRHIESGDDYTAHAGGSTASGAYQFVEGTWAGYGGYQRAADAPPAVQDAKAAEHVTEILIANRGDVSAVPVVWYIGHVPPAGSAEWDQIPDAAAGNALTPRQYQTKWLDDYQQHTRGGTGSACDGVGTTSVTADGWALPGPRELIDANPDALESPHAEYPAWDWMIPTGTPVYAIRAGTVTTLHTWPFNWWDQGCDAGGRSDCTTCGIGVTITDATGARWTYCHGSTITVSLGTPVHAGEQIMASGNTGRSSGPHLHIEIRTPDDQRRCPQTLVQQIYRNQSDVDLDTLPTAGCSY